MISYRPLVASDFDFCVHVHHLAVRAYVEELWGWNQAQQDVFALEFMTYRNATHEIALVSDVPIGYLSYQDKTEALFLNKLHLHPDHQGKGYGSEILSRLIRHAQRNCKSIELTVLTTNPRARAFYERHGFVSVDANREKIRMKRGLAL